MISVENLTKDYGLHRAIDHLNFTAEKGEVLGFLGPNGAGKTTTMRILTGYMPPTSGTATIDGLDVIEDSLKVRQKVGYLPETVPLYEDMRVMDYLKFMGQLHQVPDIDDRVDEILIQVGMEERASSLIKNLSKGMRQRIGLGQALLHHPDVLILDEPTIGLDPKQIKEVRTVIKNIGKERTVMLSTHILSEAQQICDRVIIINKGRIVAEDAPENLQDRISSLRSVYVRVKENTDKAASLIRDFPGILSVKVSDEGRIQFENARDLDPRAQVAKLLVDGGFDLLELTPEKVNLEDIFLKLTRDGFGEGQSPVSQDTAVNESEA
ncbi:ATP-binding cassette domain-containing protein [Chloroflexota bacterium]|nr:ATP-binding cassette domain-containing protein [Chloroflexota bacterium]